MRATGPRRTPKPLAHARGARVDDNPFNALYDDLSEDEENPFQELAEGYDTEEELGP